jgi:hypothetical protein
MKYLLFALLLVNSKLSWAQIFGESPSGAIPEMISLVDGLKLTPKCDTIIILDDSSYLIRIRRVKNSITVHFEHEGKVFYSLKGRGSDLEVNMMNARYRVNFDFDRTLIKSVYYRDTRLTYKVNFDKDSLVSRIALINDGNKNIGLMRFSHEVMYQSLSFAVPLVFLRTVNHK